MEVSGAGKSPNATLSFRYNANNEELEELFQPCEDDPPTPQCEPTVKEPISASPKRGDKTSIIDKYFKSMRTEKTNDKQDDSKQAESKSQEESKSPVPPKEVSSSPVKDYLNRLGKRSTSESIPEGKESANETWKIFHDFKFKIAQAVEDMKTRSVDETKEKSLPRESSTSDSEENSAIKDPDQQSVGDTDNQVSSLDSSIQNLSEMTQPLTAKASERELSLANKNATDSSEETHKILDHNETIEVPKDDNVEIESGVEALEDTIDAFGDVTQLDSESHDSRPIEITSAIPQPLVAPMDFNFPPSKNGLNNTNDTSRTRTNFFNCTMYFLTIFLLLNYILFPNSNSWIGFLLGLWVFYFITCFKTWVLDNYFSEWEPKRSFYQFKQSNDIPVAYTIPAVKEHTPMKKYEGWINHYRCPDYDPYTYHINKTTTAFMKLEGCNLRLSYTTTKIAKRALWDEKIENVAFYQHRLYNLTGARIILLPKGLVRRRQWSKKYPICIILNEKEKIQVLEKENATVEKKLAESSEKKTKEQIPAHETESTETNTSPEKKKKFIWRRREKSNSQSESEPGKEGLRHRLVRKIHRDKRSDSLSSSADTDVPVASDKSPQSEEAPTPEPDPDLASKSATSTKDDTNDDEIDDSELSRIKEFLDEAELEGTGEGGPEGEWSLHVKQSRDKHAHLFLFARTGRDKHEWYRRLNAAISEANASNESSIVEEKLTSDGQETKDGIELAVYKLTEKDTVAFGKNKSEVTSDVFPPYPSQSESYEKTFWPYLFKIIQSHQSKQRHTSEVGVMCQLEPSPHDRNKPKKKKKGNVHDEEELPLNLSMKNRQIWSPGSTCEREKGEIGEESPSYRWESREDNETPLELVKRCRSSPDESERAASAERRCPSAPVPVFPPPAQSGDINFTLLLKNENRSEKSFQVYVTLEDQLMETSEKVEETDVNCPSTTGAEKQLRKRKPAIYDSEIEDSAESSSDDDSPLVQPVDSGENVVISESSSTMTEGGSSKKKFLRMVDRIATNKYFQQVTDYKYVKRAMEGLSNTDIKLQLEVHGLEGRLALNLPSPPHDRIWIGFRTNPQLVLRARPAVGARALRFAHISNWIEQKLTREFEKVLVLPNMEDILIDLMTPTPVSFE
ncbi:Testis-expressed sequence 2 protein [Papilio machaon]|uniref:Testis-expressed sequence 2 protein n=1 Tax=Papilio machaon TaxID=76193 RepID=A0A194QRV2_PAPMA|nr:Testis-expressed sequence 2 protein [Papilio machaon]